MKERPLSVTVIGSISIVAGIILIWRGGFLLVFIPSLQIGDLAWVLAVLGGGIFTLVAGIHFLKLRSWARTALEAVCWWGLACVIGYGTGWLFTWINITLELPAKLRVLEAVKVTVLAAVSAVPLIVIIKLLRGRTIRQAVLLDSTTGGGERV